MKKTLKSLMACILALLMTIPAFAAAAGTVNNDITVSRDDLQELKHPLQARKSTPKVDVSGIRNGKKFNAVNIEAKEELKDTDIVGIMVELEAAPAADVSSKLQTEKSTDYRRKLISEQMSAAARIEKRCDVHINITHNYSVLFNGFAFEGEYGLVEKINKLPGVRAFVAMEWEAPLLFNSTSQVHANEAWELSYTGKGELIAIIDTGCKVDHPAFGTDPAEPKYSRDDIQNFIAANTLAGHGAAEMTVDKVYRSLKIPFGWNYCANNANIAHQANDHGSHVAGIAAGNGGEIRGVAPDAQLAVMQVFSPNGGANWTNILPALEDAAILGVSSANLSLGSPCGSEAFFDPSYEEVLDRVTEAGVSLAMAAGNDYTAAFNNAWGSSDPANDVWGSDGYSLVQHPDYGVVGSPSTWVHGIGVAAVQNVKTRYYYIQPVGGIEYGYSEHNENVKKMAETLGGQTLDYVVLDGFGAAEDFADVDVSGKVVLISRGGGINFIDKGYNAQNAGAAACIIYNNVPGPLNMVPFGTLDASQQHLVLDGNEGQIPHIAITLDVAQIFINAENKQMFISADVGIFDAPGGDSPCNFSSWGVPSSLALKPEITAPGGGIYSATDRNISGTDYAAWDGTSMATPHIAGGMAIIRQYVNETFPDLTAVEKGNLVNCILMSTAAPILDKGGHYASPRDQGAGEMNVLSAVTTKAYITAPNTQGGRPKLELGDNPSKNGVFEMNFTVHNFGDTPLCYILEPSLLLDAIGVLGQYDNQDIVIYTGESDDITARKSVNRPRGDADGSGVINMIDATLIMRYAMNLTPCPNTAIADVNEDNVVTVSDALPVMRVALGLIEAPGGTVTVEGYEGFTMPESVTVLANGETNVRIELALTDEKKQYLNANYPSGAFIEGFIKLAPTAEGIPCLNIPFMGYYGDWNYPATIDEGYYYQDYPWNSNNIANLVGFRKGNSVEGLGINPFVTVYKTDENGNRILDGEGNPIPTTAYYLEDRNAVSPNNDGCLDNINLLYMGLMRNSYIRYVVLDSEGNELGVIGDYGVCTKGFWANTYRDQLGVNYCAFPARYDFTQFNKEELILRIEAKLDNFDGLHTVNAFTPEASKCWKWDIPFSIDTRPPILWDFNAADGKFTFGAQDEHYVAFAAVYQNNDGALGDLVDGIGVFETERDAETDIELNGSANNHVVIGDYAGNISVWLWNGTDLIAEAPTIVRPIGSGGNYEDCAIWSYAKNLTKPQWTFFFTQDLPDNPGNVNSAEPNPNAPYDKDIEGAAIDPSYNIVYEVVYKGNVDSEGNLLGELPELWKFDAPAVNLENGTLNNLVKVADLVDENGAPITNGFTGLAFDNEKGILFGVSALTKLYAIMYDENNSSGKPVGTCLTIIDNIPNGVMAFAIANEEGGSVMYYADAFGYLMRCPLDGPNAGQQEEIVNIGISPLTPDGEQFYYQSGCMYNRTFYWGSVCPNPQGLSNPPVKDLIRIDVDSGSFESLGVLVGEPGMDMIGMFCLGVSNDTAAALSFKRNNANYTLLDVTLLPR